MVGKKDADLDEKGFITSTQEELIYLNNKGIKIKDRNYMLATIEIFHLYMYTIKPISNAVGLTRCIPYQLAPLSLYKYI